MSSSSRARSQDKKLGMRLFVFHYDNSLRVVWSDKGKIFPEIKIHGKRGILNNHPGILPIPVDTCGTFIGCSTITFCVRIGSTYAVVFCCSLHEAA